MKISPFTAKLLQWYEQHGRSLPWRALRNPYAIWLSEIILQQTRVEQGRPYWERFMQRFPTVGDLASASEDEVLRLWQGLGYYSRARNLHAAAQQIVTFGHFPETFEELKKLKGVGDYTAAAIASIAFDEPVAVVDGNVYRVLARHFGIDTPINSPHGKRLFAALAQDLLPTDKPSAFNQAMMDFGATWCTPQLPLCAQCPLMETCEARCNGRVDELPVKLKTTKVRERHFTYIYIMCKDEIAIRRRPAGDIWQGLWEVPMFEAATASERETELPAFLSKLFGKRLSAPPVLLKKDVRHLLTHRKLLADFYYLETPIRPSLSADYVWIKEDDYDDYGKPRLMELLLQSLAAIRG